MARQFTTTKEFNKIPFIIQNVLFLGVAMFFSVLFIITVSTDYPSEESLVYEECTFIKYEHNKRKNGKYNEAHYYSIYVKEYKQPLEIDNIVFDDADKDVLSGIKEGDKITVCKYEDDGEMILVSASYNGDYVLTFDDYITIHKENDTALNKVWIFFIIIFVSLFIWGVIHYKRTGECLSAPKAK